MRKLLISLGREPSDQEIADNGDFTLNEVTELRYLLDFLSPEGDDNMVLTSGVVSDEWLIELMDKSKIVNLIRQFQSQLTNEREKVIFNQRLLAEEPLSLEEIGEQFGVSKERIRQLELRLKGKFKEHIVSLVSDFQDNN